MTETVIHVARDFTRYPAGRFTTDGIYSGERFRSDYLIPALSNNDFVTVMLDGTLGFGSSFLEEAFGGLVRNGFDRTVLETKLKLVASDKTLCDEIWDYIRSADK